MQCVPLANGSCVPTPNWECSDYECMLQCLNQPTFDAFEQCCIQCVLSQYTAQAKDHLTIIVANAVSSINEEIIPVFDTGNILIAYLETLTGAEKINVNDLFNYFKAKVIKQKFTEEVTCNDISAPCFSDTGFCTPPSPTLSQFEAQLGYNISCFTTFPPISSTGVPFSTSSGSQSAPAPTTRQITQTNITTQTPPTTQTQTQSTTLTQTTTQTQVIQYICGVANTCYRMLGIEVIDPSDVYFNYQETPTGIVESAGYLEVAGVYDQPLIEEAPSRTTETGNINESVTFILSYLVTATLPVLEVSFAYPITLVREIESVTATRSVQTVYFTYPIAKQTFTESVTATSVSILGYFQPPIKLVTESEVTSSSQQIFQIKITKPVTFYQSVPTSVTQLIATLDIIRTVTPERLAEYTNAVRSVLDALVFQVVTEVLKSFPTSASQETLIGYVAETVKKVLVPEVTSSTQEFLDALIYQTVKQVVQSILTSQTETFQATYFSEKVTPTQISESTSQTETFQLTYFSQQISPTLISEQTSQTETFQTTYIFQEISPTQVSESSSQTEEVLGTNISPPQTVAWFNGQNAYASGYVPQLNNATTFSWVVWFKTTSSYGIIMSNNGGSASLTGQFCGSGPGSYIPNIYVYNGQLYINIFTNGCYQYSTGKTVNDGNWHMVAVVISGTSLTVYLDGGVVISQTLNTNYYQYSSAYFWLGMGRTCGCWSSGSFNSGSTSSVPVLSAMYQGYIAQVQLYNVALTSSQISQIYNAGFNGSVTFSGLVAFWYFPAQTCNDQSGNGNNLTCENVVFTTSGTYSTYANYYNGSNAYSYIEIAQLSPPSCGDCCSQSSFDMTYVLWVWLSTNSNMYILGDQETNSPNCTCHWNVLLSDSYGDWFGGYYGGCTFYNGGSVTVGEWVFIAVVINGDVVQFYLNGSYVAESGTFTPNVPYPYYVYLGYGANCGCWTSCSGSGSSCASGYFNGYIAQLQVYDAVLSSSQIQLLYECGTFHTCAFANNLVGYQAFFNQSCSDISGYNNSTSCVNTSYEEA
jgi:hypothetical protein